MATTMNPVGQYRDASRDDTVPYTTQPRQYDSAQRRKTGDEELRKSREGDLGQPIESPEIATGPPITYRGSNLDPRVHRSFSQRAKGRPFANEAFADDVGDDYPPSKPHRTNGRSVSEQYPSQTKSDGVAPRANGQTTRTLENSGPALQDTARSVPRTKPRVVADREALAANNPVIVTRSGSQRDAGNQTDDQRRNWASDRSPLQKLEVKLTDISKEEKRARVQEAEMRLRDSQPAQGSRRSQRQSDQTSRGASQPVRANIPQIIEPAKPSTSRSTQDVKPRSAGIEESRSQSKRQKVPLQGPIADIPVRQYDTSQRASAPGKTPQALDQRTVDPREARNREPQKAERMVASLGPAAPSQIPRPVSLQQKRQSAPPRGLEKPLSERERNASHQAALQQLTGQPPSPDLLKGATLRKSTGSGRAAVSQDSPIGVDISTISGEQQQFNSRAPRTPQKNRGPTVQPQTTRPPVGLGVQNASDAQALNRESSESTDPNRNKQRKSSVSFKEPFDKRRPIDEWKAAETARLVADDFLTEQIKDSAPYKPWWEQDQTPKGRRARASSAHSGPPAPIDDRTASFNPSLYLKCGPLLRYAGLKKQKIEPGSQASPKQYWRGTVMIVTQDSKCSYEAAPTLRLFSQPRKLLPPPPALVTSEQLAPEYIDPIAGLTKISRTGHALYVRPVDHLEEAKDLSQIEDDNGVYEASPSPLDVNGSKNATSAATNKRTLDTDGEQLGRFKEVKGVRIYADPDRDVTFWRFNIEVELGPEQQHIAYRINKSAATGFWVPAQGQTMNIMFHSCNGFSMSVDSNEFSGPDPLWRDVLNNHQTRPFHVMIGGGDQIYNDRVMADTHHFGDWTHIRNPHHKHQAPFTPEMKNELESFYLERYCMWFSQGLFGMANASIPMVNIWDDHDIIDGFGSYPDDFMKTPVFMGLGDIAHKYYLLFQHQSIDAMTEKDEPSWVLGKKPGPYIQRLSRSVYLELGQRVAFLGLDARTERTRDDVISIDTLEIILERCRKEMVEGQTKHLILLLGVPIAYPRMVWLENVLTSRALDPIKALHRAGIVKTKLLNRFDGGVEVLDDLDDHWTAKNHKDERNILIQDLQDLAAEKSARVTILSGDVHLAAVGQFYSNPKLKIPKDKDHRYMPNIVSSAIVNTPPPDMLADVLNKRNKVHHLDKYTDENMIPMFTHDVDDKKRNNNHLLPRRNWCSIREYLPGDTPPPTPSPPASVGDDGDSYNSEEEWEQQNQKRRMSFDKNNFNPRNLMRRFSSRGAPPNSYKVSADGNQFERRAASLDGVDRTKQPYGQSPQLRASSADHVPDVPALRPTFLRRPTNLSEKAAKKGIVPAIDADGNEIDVNNNVNLEGGLDIVLNCEVNQKDPAGITTQYRLLVPALWYDGSSDREKLNTAPALNRRGTLLQKFGLNPRRNNQAADNQGGGNWGQEMSETESYTESEEGQHDPPKKRFSLFGSRKKKQPQQLTTDDIQHPHFGTGQPEQNNREVLDPENPNALTSHRTAPLPPNVVQSARASADRSLVQEPRTSQTYYQPPVDSAPQQPLQKSASDRIPFRSSRVSQPASNSHQSVQPSSSQRSSQSTSRPLSYIIGGGNNPPPLRSEYSSDRVEGRPPYDPDAAYVSSQQAAPATDVRRSQSERQAPQSRGMNMGTGPMEEKYDMNDRPPQHRILRGNGILGKHFGPSSFRQANSNPGSDHNSIGMHYNNPPETSRGYSGIEAYKEPKPRRRWSLRERARNMIDNLDVRRRRDDDDWYSDEEEEEYWEGPRQDGR